MTIDERIEYLMQSIESHDRQIAELTDNVAVTSASVRNLTSTVDNLSETVDNLGDKVTRTSPP